MYSKLLILRFTPLKIKNETKSNLYLKRVLHLDFIENTNYIC